MASVGCDFSRNPFEWPSTHISDEELIVNKILYAVTAEWYANAVSAYVIVPY